MQLHWASYATSLGFVCNFIGLRMQLYWAFMQLHWAFMQLFKEKLHKISFMQLYWAYKRVHQPCMQLYWAYMQVLGLSYATLLGLCVGSWAIYANLAQ